MHLFSPLLILLLRHDTYLFSFAQECCHSSDSCKQSCPWNDACDDGKDISCKDRISGVFKCRDKSLCAGYDDCDEVDAATRAGHLCTGFPLYNGGYPLDKLNDDNEDETYECTAPSSSAEYCSEWITTEDSPTEFERGNAICTQASSNNKYCAKWHIDQFEYRKCWVGFDTDGRYVQYCCGSDSVILNTCCQQICSVSFYNAFPPEQEQADCECTQESEDGGYCERWHCEEYAYLGQTFDYGRELEDYFCSKGVTLTSNGISGSYCDTWQGSIDSIEEFEVSRCKCQELSVNGPYCESWQCYEIGYDYHWPNLLWSIFSIIMSLPVPIAFTIYYLSGNNCDDNAVSDEVSKERKLSKVCISLLFTVAYLLWCGGFVIIGIWKAGVGVLVISAPILLLPVIYFYFNRYFCQNKQVEIGGNNVAAGGGPMPSSEYRIVSNERTSVHRGFELEMLSSNEVRKATEASPSAPPYNPSPAAEEGVSYAAPADARCLLNQSNIIPQAVVIAPATRLGQNDKEEERNKGDEEAEVKSEIKVLKGLLEEGLIAEAHYERRLNALVKKLKP